MNRVMPLGLILVAFYSLPVHSATRLEQTRACRADVFRYCRAAIPSEARITACMKRRLPELSAGCRAMF